MEKTTIIGARTRSLREYRNWSQEDLAKESGLKRPHISLIETGDRMPGADTLAKLADAFQVSVDFLMGRSDNPAIAPTPNHPALKDPAFAELATLWPGLDPEDVAALLFVARSMAAKTAQRRSEE